MSDGSIFPLLNRPELRNSAIVIGSGTALLRRVSDGGYWVLEKDDPAMLAKAWSVAVQEEISADHPFFSWLDRAGTWLLRSDFVKLDQSLADCPLTLPDDPQVIRRFEQALGILRKDGAAETVSLRMKLDDLQIDRRPPDWSSRTYGLRLTGDGLTLGDDIRLATYDLRKDGSLRLLPVGGRERVLGFLSVACGRALSPDVLRRIDQATAALNKGDASLAGIILGQVGIWPPLDPTNPTDPRLAQLRDLSAAEAEGIPWHKLAGALRQSGFLKYSPDQPRVPAGDPDGGQWCDAGGGEETAALPVLPIALEGGKGDGSDAEVKPEKDVPDSMKAALDGVNPTQSSENCVSIAEAVVKRLSGESPNAVSDGDSSSKNKDIENYYGGKVNFGYRNISQVFDTVEKAGDGAIAVMVIVYLPSKNGHIVVVANDHGKVGIIEAQEIDGNSPNVITNRTVAEKIYGGNSNLIGVLLTNKKIRSQQ